MVENRTYVYSWENIWYTINMDKNIFTIRENDLSYGRGYVYSLQYHLVWCTKYRKKVLQNRLDEACKNLWNPSYCAVTVSDRSKEQVLTYIKGQKEKEAGK